MSFARTSFYSFGVSSSFFGLRFVLVRLFLFLVIWRLGIAFRGMMSGYYYPVFYIRYSVCSVHYTWYWASSVWYTMSTPFIMGQ